MLNGRMENCYGIKEFNLPEINFTECNKVIIYAPNGVMKTSFSKIFEDISQRKASNDRIFKGVTTSYSITYNANEYNFTSDCPQELPAATDNIYVVNSFADKFEFAKETVSTLLADEATRNEYNDLMEEFSGDIRKIEKTLNDITGLTKPKIKGVLIEDLKLLSTSDWTDIFEKAKKNMTHYVEQEFLKVACYSELFNEKALAIYQKSEFQSSITEYIESLGKLLSNSNILSEHFTERSAEALGKAFLGNDLFKAQHKIQLRDGSIINSLEQWNAVINKELEVLYQAPELSSVFGKLKKLFTTNNEGNRLRDIIIEHREIIPYLKDIPALKKQVWLNCLNRLDRPFSEYYDKISVYTEHMRLLYDRAAAQSDRWQRVVSEFNRRFRVPFVVKINNKANFLLKDEAPNISFIYTRGVGEMQQSAELRKDELMLSLSMGEKRALYLLYILFDLESIRGRRFVGDDRFLIIADDIADSFDYKNKYAIIEYLNDISLNNGIDLLMLTHNFDFYRTVKLRLKVFRSNCFIAQKDSNGVINMTVFKYQKDFFKNIIIAEIKNGDIGSDDKRKLLIASIPFYRNLCEYSGKEDDYKKLTCFLHQKTIPLSTNTVNLSDLWSIVSCYLENAIFTAIDEDYNTALQRIASIIIGITNDEVSLENKLVVSIATRLTAEKFLKRKIIENEEQCLDSENNQTRDWFTRAITYLSTEEKEIIEEVILITPESIHLNAFMYEPLIDISDWTLKSLYQKVIAL